MRCRRLWLLRTSVVYYLVATNASPHDRGLWSLYTGAYALGAFPVIGLPGEAPLGFLASVCGMAVYRALLLPFETWLVPQRGGD